MKYLTTAKAAVLLGISASLVRRYGRQGRLGWKVGRDHVITLDDIARFQATPRKVGRPPKAREVRP